MALRALTVADLFAKARRLAHEPTTQRFSRDDVLDWVNDAQEEFVSRLYGAAPRTRYTLAGTVASQQEYPVPDAVMTVHTVRYYDGTDWKRLGFLPYQEQLGNHYDEEAIQPSFYYVRDNLIGLIPVPSSSGTSDLRIFTSYVPDELTDEADEPLGGSRILKVFRKALVPYIVAQMKISDSKQDQHAYWMGIFAEGVAQAKRHLNMRVNDSTNAPRARVGYGPNCPFSLEWEGTVGTESAPDPDYVP
jgi:hypothetical protein